MGITRPHQQVPEQSPLVIAEECFSREARHRLFRAKTSLPSRLCRSQSNLSAGEGCKASNDLGPASPGDRDAQSDRILGFTMLGAGAGEVIAVVQTAMLAGLRYTGLRDAILTHPTMAEGLNVLFANVPT
ncbi:MAG: hypothetical protein ACHBNF_18185 [Chromatiales bacterium]